MERIYGRRVRSQQGVGGRPEFQLGHLVTNSAKEQDAEKAVHEFRKRLKQAQLRRGRESF
jgi:hypothetical protein